jgi:hypothetical protein
MMFGLLISLLTLAGQVCIHRRAVCTSADPPTSNVQHEVAPTSSTIINSSIGNPCKPVLAYRQLSSMTLLHVVLHSLVDFLELLSLQSQFLSQDLSTSIAMLVMPVSASLLPVVYTYSILQEKRRAQREEAILKLLKVNMMQQQKVI